MNLYPIVFEADTYVNTMNASQNLRSYSSRVFPDADTFRLITYNKNTTTYYKYESMSDSITWDVMDDYSGLFTTLYVSSAVTNLDYNMFSSCASSGAVEEIRFYNGESSITSMTPFNHAGNLKTYGSVGSGANVEIPSSVTYFGGYNNAIITEAVLPNTVKTISFYNFHNLTKCIAAGVTSISFYGSSGITSVGEIGSGEDVELGASLTEIKNEAFYQCTSLTSVTLGNITSIGNTAFYGCSGLTSITIKAITPPTLRYDVFTNTNNCPIYVPAQSVDTYKSASGWSTYASRIQAIQ